MPGRIFWLRCAMCAFLGMMSGVAQAQTVRLRRGSRTDPPTLDVVGTYLEDTMPTKFTLEMPGSKKTKYVGGEVKTKTKGVDHDQDDDGEDETPRPRENRNTATTDPPTKFALPPSSVQNDVVIDEYDTHFLVYQNQVLPGWTADEDNYDYQNLDGTYEAYLSTTLTAEFEFKPEYYSSSFDLFQVVLPSDYTDELEIWLTIVDEFDETYELYEVFEIPEPATLSLLALGSLALTRRRRA